MLRRLIINCIGSYREKRLRAMMDRGFQFQSGGDLTRAIEHYRKAAFLNPRRAEALCLLGNALRLTGEVSQAAVVLRDAVAAAPDSADAHLLLVTVLPMPRCRDEAIAAMRRVLDLRDDDPNVRMNCQLACLLRDKGDYEEAISHFEKALEIHGDSPEWNIQAQLANVLHAVGRADDAREFYARAWQLNRSDAFRIRRATIIPPIPGSLDHIARIREEFSREVGALVDERLQPGQPERDIGHTDFLLAYHGLNDCPLKVLLARMYEHAYPSLRFVSPNLDIGIRKNGKLRIGIVSKYLRVHTIGRLMLGFFRHYRRTEFEVTAFVFEEATDEIAREIHSRCDRVTILKPVLEDARRSIAEAQVDILLYTDIGMESFTYLLAFARLAPVQCVTWGHPVTTGLPGMDYFISSALVEPAGASAHYSETLECLPESCAWVCFQRPEAPRPLPGRERFNLPAGANLYFCPQPMFKLHPEYDAMLGEILRADKAGLLLLIDNPRYLRTQIMKRWSITLGDVLSRIRFLPKCDHSEYLALLGLADVVLDTPHFGGGHSSLEAMAMGSTVVTLPGAYARSRFTYANYRRIGVMDCVASNERDYVGIALRLGEDRSYRAAVQRRIAEASCDLFEDLGTVRALENFFTRVAARARARTTS